MNHIMPTTVEFVQKVLANSDIYTNEEAALEAAELVMEYVEENEAHLQEVFAMPELTVIQGGKS